jgi:dTDP-4-dehydrorhamnose reductase
MKKILVTGASGFVGTNLTGLLSTSYKVTGIYHRRKPTPQPGVKFIKLNLNESKNLEKVLQTEAPDCILHLAAISNASFCEEYPFESYQLNVYATVALAQYAQAKAIPMLFASTDMVFNGTGAPYEPNDFPFPILQYGSQKQQAEDFLLNDFGRHYIIRLPLLFGFPRKGASNFFSKTLSLLGQQLPIQAFTDQYRSMMSVQTACLWLLHSLRYALNEGEERVLHVGSIEQLSRFEFCKLMAQIFGFNQQLVQGVLQEELEIIPARPANTSMDIQQSIDVLGYTPPSVKEQLQQLYSIYKS